ncbi:YaaC family protein [Bacillus sp. 165]|uniref:YaaC family protein n=1 Tax=Bacillus sp. 165 TaxID=1529117 RepID=UPI001AD9773C|nr:YaaC family protein [Bacillus sp. 165]MBO9131515.1 YaaC family protein [Bacillus sp. 165]
MMNNESTWHKLSFFISSSNTQNYLYNCYKKLGLAEAEKKSFENCYPFIYYLEHGKNYYDLSRLSPLSIKPVLLFYGMIQLFKACLLTVDPEYPESTSVLAHGATTRKRKKQSYEFLQDEVKIQKLGLFTHIGEKMFHMKHLEGEKFTMEMLLKRIPELVDLFKYSKRVSLFYELEKLNAHTLSIPIEVLDSYHMTKDRLVDYIENTCHHLQWKYVQSTDEGKYLSFHISHSNWNALSCSPLAYELYKQKYFLPMERQQMNCFPELLAHYLLMYNLSMISRYETEWWSDLLHSYSTEDYPFIQQFLSISTEKVPYFIYLYLLQNPY